MITVIRLVWIILAGRKSCEIQIGPERANQPFVLCLHSYSYLCSSKLIMWGNEAITINYMHWRTSKPPLSVSCLSSHAQYRTGSRRITEFDITQSRIYSCRGPGTIKMWRPLSVTTVFFCSYVSQ
jgi:hypothetical protein